MNLRRLFPTAIALIVGTVAGAYFFRAAPPSVVAAVPKAKEPNILRFEPGAPQLSSLRTTEVETAALPLAEPLNGRVAYDEDRTARLSAPIAGRVTAIRVQTGDAVRIGDTLVLLDAPDVGAATADLEKAQADETRKSLALERASRLSEGGVLPRKDLELSQADLAQARAETQRARLRLRNLAPQGATGGGFALRSPIAGVVVDRTVTPAMEVRPDLPNPLVTVTDPTRLWVLVDLPERDLTNVATGRMVGVEVDAYPGVTFEATIARIGEAVDPTTRRIQVRCTIANPDRRLKPEMYAKVSLLAQGNQTAIRVPTAALISEGVASYIFVERSEGVFERRKVNPVVQGRQYSFLDQGLRQGERVVTSGALLLNSELSESN